MNGCDPLPRLERALAAWPRWGLGSPPVVVRQLTGGLSNSSWLVSADAGPAVGRLNSRHDHCFNIDREREAAILRHLAGERFMPDVWYCSPSEGVLVSAYVEGEVLADRACLAPRTLERVGELLAHLQEICPPLPRFDYWAHLCHYRRQVMARGIAIPPEQQHLFDRHQEMLEQFQRADWLPTLVHHDLTPANLIATDDGLVLLDWEYAAMGYPGMDTGLWFSDADPFADVVAVYRELINGLWAQLSAALAPARARQKVR